MALSLIVFDCDGVILESVDAKTKAFGIGNTVIAFVRCAKSREFIGVACPIKLSAIYNTTAYGYTVTVDHLNLVGTCPQCANRAGQPTASS